MTGCSTTKLSYVNNLEGFSFSPLLTVTSSATAEISRISNRYTIKVIDVGTNQKPVCDFLLVNNTNLRPILHHFQVILDYR